MTQMLPSGPTFKRRSGGELAKLSNARDVGMSVPEYRFICEVESGSKRSSSEADHSVVAVPFRALVTTVGVMVVKSRTVDAFDESPFLEQRPALFHLL
jgi:hypothetical protein